MDKYTVLFVDDEPNILRSLARLFYKDPVKVLTASDAEQALGIVSSQPVHVVVSDNMMPGMTGVELIKRLKDISPDSIRILLSGQSGMEAVLEAVNKGEAFRFLTKPWNDEDLKANVFIALAQYRLQDNVKELHRRLEEKDKLLAYLFRHYPELAQVVPPGNVIDLDDSHTATPTLAGGKG
jgi:DNA-binding NtrC family response regulator